MDCRHEGFHSCGSRYDRARGQLVFVVVCDRCGAVVKELSRERYRPRFEPRGSEPYLTAARLGA